MRRPRLTTSRAITATGAAAADVVWSRYVHPDAWTSWAPHLTAVRSSTPTIEPGTTGTVTALGLVRARYTVTHVDHDTKVWAWTVRTGPIRLHLTHTVSAAADGATTTGLRVAGPVGVVEAYLPVAQHALRSLVEP